MAPLNSLKKIHGRPKSKGKDFYKMDSTAIKWFMFYQIKKKGYDHEKMYHVLGK
jgi:hypothetical protein